MTERKYNERHDRQKTHELVVLNNTPASSAEQNYAQLKTIRSPDNTYEQLVLRQVSHNEVCEDELKDKENAVTHEERCQTGGYENKGEKTTKPSVFACALYIGIPIITALIISAMIVAIIGLSHADSTANKEAGLREMSVNMAEQVVALQAELGALQRELNASMEYWETLQMQQAVSTQKLINDSIAHLQQHFQTALTQQNNDLGTALTQQNNDLRRAITQQNNDLQMTKTTVSNNIDELSQTRADVNQLNSKLHTHINTYESSVEVLHERDNTLQQNMERANVQVTMKLSSIRNDVTELTTNNNNLSSSLESHINTYESNAEEFRDRDDMLQRDIDGVSAEVSTGLTWSLGMM